MKQSSHRVINKGKLKAICNLIGWLGDVMVGDESPTILPTHMNNNYQKRFMRLGPFCQFGSWIVTFGAQLALRGTTTIPIMQTYGNKAMK